MKEGAERMSVNTVRATFPTTQINDLPLNFSLEVKYIAFYDFQKQPPEVFYKKSCS